MSAELETKTLPLKEHHEARGAKPAFFQGWEVPNHYGQPEKEYFQARNDAAVFDASFLSVVQGTGSGHVEYLNRRLSQLVVDMVPGEIRRANQLKGDGRMEADLEFALLEKETSWLLALPAIPGETLQQIADKYVFTEDAQFRDVSPDWAVFAVVGPKGCAALLKLLGWDEFESHRGEIAGCPVTILRSEFFYQSPLVFTGQKDASRVHEALTEASGSPLGFQALNTLRIEAGMPWWGFELNEKSMPLEADLMSAIHTNKGCYPGQETIAKTMNLGHPAKKMVGVILESEEPPAAGSDIVFNGKEIGVLTSASYSPRHGKAIGLAMMKWIYFEPDLAIETQGIAGSFVELPFPSE